MLTLCNLYVLITSSKLNKQLDEPTTVHYPREREEFKK